VQDAAHEDANIIFGAVLDEGLPEGELRVTVIATGLDDGQPGRRAPREDPWERRDRPHEEAPASAVRPLRPEPADPAPPAARQRDLGLERERGERQSGDWVSPFEDELDVPAFLRRQAD